jgi:hypothetical protein
MNRAKGIGYMDQGGGSPGRKRRRRRRRTTNPHKNPPISDPRFTLTAIPLWGVWSLEVNLRSEIGRFGLIVRVGSPRRMAPLLLNPAFAADDGTRPRTTSMCTPFPELFITAAHFSRCAASIFAKIAPFLNEEGGGEIKAGSRKVDVRLPGTGNSTPMARGRSTESFR